MTIWQDDDDRQVSDEVRRILIAWQATASDDTSSGLLGKQTHESCRELWIYNPHTAGSLLNIDTICASSLGQCVMEENCVDIDGV